MSIDALADIQSRILAIQNRLGSMGAPGVARGVPLQTDEYSLPVPAPETGQAFSGALDQAMTLTGGPVIRTGQGAAAGGGGGSLSAAATAPSSLRPSGPPVVPSSGPEAPAAEASAGPSAVRSGGGVSRADIVASARRYLGIPYLWGGTDPAKGLDCSGLVMQVFKDHGIDLPRVSYQQATQGRAVPTLAQARPGDLLAFDNSSFRPGIDHIAIYIGDGKMIEAPRPGRDVRIADVPGTPVAIRRILGEVPGSAPAASAPRVSGGSTAGTGLPAAAAPFVGLFRAAAARHGVPADLLAAVAKAESAFRPDAVSHAGARGLMQIMPGTARELGVNPMVPAQAVDGAARLLKSHLRTFGSTELALAAYNAGPGAVRRYDGIPPYAETRAYVRKVTAAMGEISL